MNMSQLALIEFMKKTMFPFQMDFAKTTNITSSMCEKYVVFKNTHTHTHTHTQKKTHKNQTHMQTDSPHTSNKNET